MLVALSCTIKLCEPIMLERGSLFAGLDLLLYVMYVYVPIHSLFLSTSEEHGDLRLWQVLNIIIICFCLLPVYMSFL